MAVAACSVQDVELVKLAQLLPPYADPGVDTPSKVLSEPEYKALVKLADPIAAATNEVIPVTAA